MLPEKAAAADGIFRLLFVHAHPDDESITTGGTMAYFARSGAQVTLLTSTRGELGEVIPADLRYLEQGLPKPGRAGQSIDDGGAGLARMRTAELNQAAAELGVSQRMFLGEAPALEPGADPVIYRDSGMMWAPNVPGQRRRAIASETVLPGSFSRAPLDEVANHTAALIRALRPDVVVSYASDGGYGHPDHVRTHEMTGRALELASMQGDAVNPAWRVPLDYEILSSSELEPGATNTPLLWVDGSYDAKRTAMLAHRTQIVVNQDQYALSDLEFKPISAVEGFRLGAHTAARQPSLPPRRTISEWVGYALSALLAGVISAFLGTALHLQTMQIGDASLPWGAALALVLVAAVLTLVGSWARSPTMGLLSGAAAYLSCVVLAIPHGRIGLIIANPAGNIWLYGVAVVTVLYCLVAMVLAGRSKAARGRRNSDPRDAQT